MGVHIDNYYSGLKTEKDHILTEKAEKEFEELKKHWKALTKNLADEENIDYVYLRVLFENFLNTCCKDHFSKGFKTALCITDKITDKILPLSDN